MKYARVRGYVEGRGEGIGGGKNTGRELLDEIVLDVVGLGEARH
jgi:hypothetical protein